MLWSCFLYFVWNWELKCWKYEAKLVQELQLGHPEPAQNSDGICRRATYLCLFVSAFGLKGPRVNPSATSSIWESRQSPHHMVNTIISYRIHAVWNDYCTVIHLNYRNGFKTKPVKTKNRLPTLWLQTIKLWEQQRCHFQESSSSNFKPKHHIIGLMPV